MRNFLKLQLTFNYCPSPMYFMKALLIQNESELINFSIFGLLRNFLFTYFCLRHMWLPSCTIKRILCFCFPNLMIFSHFDYARFNWEDRLQLLEIRFDDMIVKKSPTQQRKNMWMVCSAGFFICSINFRSTTRSHHILFLRTIRSRHVCLQSDEIVIKMFTTFNKLSLARNAQNILIR